MEVPKDSGGIELTGSLTPEGVGFVSNITYYAIQICTNDGEPLVSIKMDGTVEYGKGYTPDEAAKQFWEAMARWPSMVEKQQGQLERRTNALSNALFTLQQLQAKSTYKKGVLTVADMCEPDAKIKSAIYLAEQALSDLEKEPPMDKGVMAYLGNPENMSDEELCQKFAGHYQIHSNPAYYNTGKAGHDELLKRLRLLRRFQMDFMPQ